MGDALNDTFKLGEAGMKDALKGAGFAAQSVRIENSNGILAPAPQERNPENTPETLTRRASRADG